MEYLTVEEFAKKLKMHPGTIRRCIKEGKIYATRLSDGIRSPYRINTTELERLHVKSMQKIKEENI